MSNAFIDQLKSGGAAFADEVSNLAGRFKNESFKDAILAIGALVAAADGEIQKEEKAAAAAVIQKNAALRLYEPSALARQFNGYCTQALDEISRLDVEQVYLNLRGKADQADLAVKLSIIIARSKGGELAEVEKNVLRQIVKKLRLEAADYGL